MNCGDLMALEGFNPDNFYDQYAAWTDTVAKYPPTAEPFYLALGIADEAGELLLTSGFMNILKEAGDVLWYAARYSTRVLKVPFGLMIEEARLGPSNITSNKAFGSIGTICGVEKKRIRDGDLWDGDTIKKKQRAAHNALVDVLIWLQWELSAVGFTLSDAIDANRGKLNKRAEEGTLRGDGDQR